METSNVKQCCSTAEVCASSEPPWPVRWRLLHADSRKSELNYLKCHITLVLFSSIFAFLQTKTKTNDQIQRVAQIPWGYHLDTPWKRDAHSWQQ